MGKHFFFLKQSDFFPQENKIQTIFMYETEYKKKEKKKKKFRRFLSFLCLKPNEKKFPDECFNDKNWMMNCFRPLEENLHKFLHFFFPLWKHETSENNFSFLKII